MSSYQSKEGWTVFAFGGNLSVFLSLSSLLPPLQAVGTSPALLSPPCSRCAFSWLIGVSDRGALGIFILFFPCIHKRSGDFFYFFFLSEKENKSPKLNLRKL